MTGLDAAVEVRRGGFLLSAALAADEGDTVALLGPNGSGKSTLLHALAGLIPLQEGRITVGERLVSDLPAHRRRVGLVFQDHALFTHLSVEDNVAFGPRSRGLPAGNARAVARDWLRRIGLTELASARPDALSGGQAQRVALARALAAEPALLLLDEPLAALDASSRSEVRAELRRHLQGFPGVAIVVTHDPIDVLVLAQRTVVLQDGQVAQTGSAAEVLARPRTSFAAALAGVNLISGTATAGGVRTDGFVVQSNSRTNGPAVAAFRPSAVTVHPERPQSSARNVWPVRIDRVEHRGDVVRIIALATPAITIAADVTLASAIELDLAAQADVWFAVKATEVDVYPS